MGSTSRRKGHDFERAIARRLREAGLIGARRHLEYQAEEAAHGRDLDDTFPFAFQCKCWAKMPSANTLYQIIPNFNYSIRIAVMAESKRGSKRKEVAVMEFETFLFILNILTRYDGLLEELARMVEDANPE